MTKEGRIFGFVGILIGIIMYLKTLNVWYSSIPIIIGISLIAFSKKYDA